MQAECAQVGRQVGKPADRTATVTHFVVSNTFDVKRI